VRDWRYADGESFYSPSAFSRLLRHSNGKLYWIGNICPEPPQGNMPRHPLVIAEVDETQPALIRETVTVVDTKGEHEIAHPYFQLSNFSAFENTQSGAVELYLTRYGESPEHWLKANAYRYVIDVLTPGYEPLGSVWQAHARDAAGGTRAGTRLTVSG